MSEDPEMIPTLRARWDSYDVVESDDALDANAAGRALGQALCDLNAPWTEADETKFESILEWIEEDEGDDGEDDVVEHDPECDDPDCDFHGPSPEGDQEELRAILDDAGRLRRPDGSFVAEPETVLDAPAAPLSRPGTPGRNDPCWCGSAKKYKKCHLEADGA